jgi:hypothetical protein
MLENEELDFRTSYLYQSSCSLFDHFLSSIALALNLFNFHYNIKDNLVITVNITALELEQLVTNKIDSFNNIIFLAMV